MNNPYEKGTKEFEAFKLGKLSSNFIFECAVDTIFKPEKINTFRDLLSNDTTDSQFHEMLVNLQEAGISNLNDVIILTQIGHII